MIELQKTVIAVSVFPLWFVGCVSADEPQRPSMPTTDPTPAVQGENVENVFERIECYATLATDKDDPSVCDQASHEGVKYQCYAVLAERRGSRELCDVIPSRSPDHQKLRDSCTSDVAKKALSPTLCEDIQTTGLRDSCYAKIGRETENTALCRNIQDLGLRSMCSGEPVTVE